MNQSDLFSYLSAFVTIVLAVAITDMIQSTHRLIRGRQRVKWDIAHLIFALFVAAAVISEFFSLWATFEVTRISFLQLLWMLVIPTLTALLAYSVLPDEVPEKGLDLREFYLAERKTWVVILGVAAFLDIARSVMVLSHNPQWVVEYLKYVAMFLPPVLIGLWLMWVGWSRRWDLAGVLLATLPAAYSMTVWTISSKPAS